MIEVREHNTQRLAYRIAILCCAFVFLFSCGGVAYGAWQVNDESATSVSTTTVDVVVVGNMAPETPQHPGSDITREIQAENNGSADVFVRMNIDTYFSDASGNRVEDPLGLVEVTYNNNAWKDGGDGYYYLKGELEPGGLSDSIIEQIVLSTDITSEYAEYEAGIYASVEAIQTTSSAVKNAWGKDYAFMEADEPDPKPQGQAEITFVSPDAGFIFDPDTKDLYPNAKDLTSGESVEHAIAFKNDYAEAIKVTVSSGEFTRAADEELFSRHATLRITDEAGKLIFEGPALGEAWEQFSYNMNLAAGQEMIWYATLTIDHQAGNHFQGLTTEKLSWELVAQEPDPTPGPSPDPQPSPKPDPGSSVKTGDAPWLYISLITLIISGLFLIILVRKSRKERGDERG